MAFSLLKVKNILNQKKGRLAGSGSTEPEVGLRVAAKVSNPGPPLIKVTLIGARHLPSLFGLTTAKGYVVKVKLFPGNLKFESQMEDSTWPVWNEEFDFPIETKKGKKNNVDPVDISFYRGYFVSLTMYAILEMANPPKEDNTKKGGKAPETTNSKNEPDAEKSTSALAKFENFVSTSFKKSNKSSQGSMSGYNKRRMVGVATWTFDLKSFQNNLKNGLMGTPDIWRPIEQMGSGLAPANGVKENKKGQVEVTLLYTSSEDGCKDTIQVNVNKMRCTVQTMQEHESHKEPLYIKAAISDREREAHWKSDRFFPTISARWDNKTSCCRLRFDSRNLSSVTVYVSIGCKNSVGVKEVLGKVVIGDDTPYAEIWQEVIGSPGLSKTNWFPFA